MSVPKQRHTTSRRDRRRANIKLTKKKLIACSHCKKMTQQHTACKFCGYYKGRKKMETAKKMKKTKAGKKKKEE